MGRAKHPDKHIELAIREAEKCGWHYKKAGNSSHAWGRLFCAYADRDGCRISIWSTPRNSFDHAQKIRAAIRKCNHGNE